MEYQKELIDVLNNELAIEFQEKISIEELEQKLSEHINYLIQNNFQQLVALLYRVDVSESKLKALLQENTDADAGIIIANLIIERQLQKLKSRQEFGKKNNNISDEEKW